MWLENFVHFQIDGKHDPHNVVLNLHGLPSVKYRPSSANGCQTNNSVHSRHDGPHASSSLIECNLFCVVFDFRSPGRSPGRPPLPRSPRQSPGRSPVKSPIKSPLKSPKGLKSPTRVKAQKIPKEKKSPGRPRKEEKLGKKSKV